MRAATTHSAGTTLFTFTALKCARNETTPGPTLFGFVGHSAL